MIRIFQKEAKENKNADEVVDSLIQKNIKVLAIMLRATPIMEALTGLMIAGLFFL